MYILTEEPRESGTFIAGAFDAIDQVYGTEPFSKDQGVKAITTVMAVGTSEAESLFRDLVSKDYVSEA